MRTKKRTLVTNKVYGFNPWMDQLLSINQIMETTGQKSEAPIIRELIDEALTARRRKTSASESAAQAAPTQELSEDLRTIQTLLLKLIDQGQMDLRIESLSLELLQETLAEARAGRIDSWKSLAAPALKESGKSDQQIAGLFAEQTEEARCFAYVLADEIKRELLRSTHDSSLLIIENDDERQGRLNYDDLAHDPDTRDESD